MYRRSSLPGLAPLLWPEALARDSRTRTRRQTSRHQTDHDNHEQPTETPAAEAGGRGTPTDFRKPLVRRQLRFIARSLHGEVTLAGEKHRVIAFQRGGVQKVSQTSLTVKSNDGFV